MSDLSQPPHSTPPETSPIRRSLFQRLREYLAYDSGHPAPFYPTFDPSSAIRPPAEPEWVRESRASLEAQDNFRKWRGDDATNQTPWECKAPAQYDSTDAEFGAHFAERYPLGMPEDAMRRQAWYDNIRLREREATAWQHKRTHQRKHEAATLEVASLTEERNDYAILLCRERQDAQPRAERVENLEADLKNAEVAYERCEKTLAEEREKLRAATNRADMLNAAIQYATSRSEWYGGEDWLKAWNEGDENADDELWEWRNGPGKDVLGETVAGRNGVPDVPPPVGRERPEPAPVQSTPGSVTPYTFKGEPPAVPVHPTSVNLRWQPKP